MKRLDVINVSYIKYAKISSYGHHSIAIVIAREGGRSSRGARVRRLDNKIRL
jgi:hypothetical protein